MRIFDYIIVCKSPDYKNIDRISQFMLFFAVLANGYTLYRGAPIKPMLLIAITSAFVLWWMFCYYQKSKGGIPYYRLGLLFASWSWFLLPNGLLIAAIYLIAALFERQVKFPYEIAFDPNGIVINTFPKKHYSWNAIQNALIKDDIITIDFKNNHLIQKEINEPVTANVVTEFNQFCQEQLTTTK